MLAALAAGQRDPAGLAEMAKGSMRSKTAVVMEALIGFFTDDHGVILSMMLDNNRISSQITVLDARIEEAVAPFLPTGRAAG
jgi:transposase